MQRIRRWVVPPESRHHHLTHLPQFPESEILLQWSVTMVFLLLEVNAQTVWRNSLDYSNLAVALLLIRLRMQAKRVSKPFE